MFCAYAVFRRNHPEIFFDGHHFLNTTLGATNTAVLLLSSFTMAWGVRCAQLGQRRGLIVCLSVTLACAGVFLGIKYMEYKVEVGPPHGARPGGHRQLVRRAVRIGVGCTGRASAARLPPAHGHIWRKTCEHADQEAGVPIPSESLYATELEQRIDNLGNVLRHLLLSDRLHAIHVICGIIAITWLLVRAVKGHFSSSTMMRLTVWACIGTWST